MGQDPVAIREEIEETRSRLGGTVEALGYKTDVKSRAQETVVELKHKAQTSFATLGLRARAQLVERRVQIWLVAGAATVAAGTVGAMVAGRSHAERRRDHLAKPARKLPGRVRQVAVPSARSVDRWLAGTTESLQKTTESLQKTVQEKRTGALRALSEEIARALAEEQQHRNPFWRKAARDAASAAATTGATLAVRRAFNRGSPGKAAA